MKNKPIEELLVGSNNKAIAIDASSSELKRMGIERDRATTHKNNIVGIQIVGGHNISGKLSYGAAYDLKCLLEDGKEFTTTIDVLDLLTVFKPSSLALLPNRHDTWIATPGAKLLTVNSLTTLAFTQKRIDAHLANIEKETKANQDEEKKTKKIAGDLTPGANVILNYNTNAIFLGYFWGSTSRYKKPKGYSSSQEIVTTNPKRNLLFLEVNYRGEEYVNIRPNTSQIKEVNNVSSDSMKKVKEFNELREGPTGDFFKTLIYGMKTPNYYGYTVKKEEVLKAIDILFLSNEKQTRIDNKKKEIIEKIMGVSFSINKKSVPFNPITAPLYYFNLETYNSPNKITFTEILTMLDEI